MQLSIVLEINVVELSITLSFQLCEGLFKPLLAFRKTVDYLLLFFHVDLVLVKGFRIDFSELTDIFVVKEICAPSEHAIKFAPQLLNYLNLRFQCHFQLLRDVDSLKFQRNHICHDALQSVLCVAITIKDF